MLSFLLLLFSQIYVVFLWQLIVNTGSNKIKIKDAVAIFYVSALGRYIPGKVWQLIGLAYLSEDAGIESEVAITASLLSQSLSIVSGIIVSLGTIVDYVKWYFVFPLMVLLLIFLYPPVFNHMLSLLSKKLRKKDLRMEMRFEKELLLFLGYVIAWILYGISFYLLLRSLDLELSIMRSIQFFSVSYLVGLFAIFVPGGLGIREGILTILLKKIGVIGYLSSLIAVVERINITITEIILGFFGFVVILLKRRS